LRGLFTNSQLQIELTKKVEAMTLKKLFVSRELTKRAIKINSLLENSIDGTFLNGIKKLPKLDCQLKRMSQSGIDSENESDTTSLNSALGVLSANCLENSQTPLSQESLQKKTEKIKLIIENQNETLKLNTSGKACPPEVSKLLDSIESILTDESISLHIDLFYVSFEYMRIAKFIFKSFDTIRHVPATIESDFFVENGAFTSLLKGPIESVRVKEISLLKGAIGFNFALDKISINPFNQQLSFNKNIMSVKLTDILENTPDKFLSYDEELECKKCSGFFSFYCKVEQFENSNEVGFWHCCICGHQNNLKNKIDYSNTFTAEYDDIVITNNTIPEPKIEIEQVDSKIIVFCVDVSGSMANSRIRLVKSSCLSTLKLLKENNPAFKVALIIFEERSTYFGSGNLNESTIPFHEWSSTGKDRARDQASTLKPICESYDQMVTAIKNLQANSGTKIMSALAHSVLLASHVNNSEVILCTDGIAEDCDYNEYNKITKYCNENGNVQINIVTFSDSDCDLNSLGRLASMTNGVVSKTSDPIKIESALNKIIEQSAKKTFVNGISIMSSYDKIKFRLNGSNAHRIDLLDKKQAEILLEFYIENNQETQGTPFLFFQIKVVKDNRTRIITKKLAIETNDCKAEIHDANIIHAFALRKLTNYIYIENNLKDAAIYLNVYKEFLNFCESYDSRVTRTVKILEGLTSINSISEMDSETLHNNHHICSHDLRGRSIISHSEIISKNTEEMKNIFNDPCSQLKEIADGMKDEVDFKKKISDKLRVFDCEFIKPYTPTAVVHMVMELMDQMYMVMKNCENNVDSDQEKNDSNQNECVNGLKNENNHVEIYYEIKHNLMKEFRKMEKVFEKFDKLQPYSESWTAKNEHLIQEMFQIILKKLEKSRKSTCQLSINMTQTIAKSEKIIKGLNVLESFFEYIIN